jgi:hypothetical protein
MLLIKTSKMALPLAFFKEVHLEGAKPCSFAGQALLLWDNALYELIRLTGASQPSWHLYQEGETILAVGLDPAPTLERAELFRLPPCLESDDIKFLARYKNGSFQGVSLQRKESLQLLPQKTNPLPLSLRWSQGESPLESFSLNENIREWTLALDPHNLQVA